MFVSSSTSHSPSTFVLASSLLRPRFFLGRGTMLLASPLGRPILRFPCTQYWAEDKQWTYCKHCIVLNSLTYCPHFFTPKNDVHFNKYEGRSNINRPNQQMSTIGCLCDSVVGNGYNWLQTCPPSFYDAGVKKTPNPLAKMHRERWKLCRKVRILYFVKLCFNKKKKNWKLGSVYIWSTLVIKIIVILKIKLFTFTRHFELISLY